MNKQLRIFVDSDAFVALAIINDAQHKKTLSILHLLIEKEALFFTSNYVFSESITVISQKGSHKTAVQYIEKMQSIENPFLIKRADIIIEEKALEIFIAQTSKNTSFVDCANIAFMRDLQLDAIFSFDHVYIQNGFQLVENIF